MKQRFYIKINPKFQFTKVSLNKQIGLNSESNLKKLLYHFDDKHTIKRYNSDHIKISNQGKLVLKDTFQYKKEMMKMINNKIDKIFTPTSFDKKNSDINSLRSKLSQNNSRLKNIDFNLNTPSNKDETELKLNINHYLSQGKINNKIFRNMGSQNKINKQESEEKENNNDISLPCKIKDSKNIQNNLSLKSDKLYLPSIPTNKIRKSNNMKILTKKIDDNSFKCNKKEKNETEKITKKNNEKNEKDFFKNINYFIDNKKSTIKVNDNRRNKDILNYIYDSEDENIYSIIKRKNLIINEQNINKIDNEKNNEINTINDEIIKKKEGDRYIIYENSKKCIDTDRIYNSRKFGLANIPNILLDKGIKNVKNFEHNLINMKKAQIDLPICIKLPKE